MRLSILVLIPLLAACNATDVTTDLSRKAAKSVVNPIVAEKFPGIPLEPATDCVIDNANSSEIFTLASAAATGPDDGTIKTVVDIASRPDTLKCLTQKEGGLFAVLSSL